MINNRLILISGGLDLKYSKLASEVESGLHVSIPDAGHRVHLDQPLAVAKAIRAFLETMEGCIPANIPHGEA